MLNLSIVFQKLMEQKLIMQNNHLDVVIPMHNLLEYRKNYRKTTGSLWNYYRDEPNSDTDDNEIKHSIINSKSFDYKTNFIGSVTQ